MTETYTVEEIVDLFDQEEYQTIMAYFEDAKVLLSPSKNKVMECIIYNKRTDLIYALFDKYDMKDQIKFVSHIIECDLAEVMSFMLQRDPNLILQIMYTNHYTNIIFMFTQKLNFIKFFMENGMRPDDKFIQLIMECAIQHNFLDVTEYLLDVGSNALTGFDFVMEKFRKKGIYGYQLGLEMINLLIKHNIDIFKYINQLCILAITEHDLDFLKFCVENGVDVNDSEWRPLSVCLKYVNLIAFKYLLENGAKLTIKASDIKGIIHNACSDKKKMTHTS